MKQLLFFTYIGLMLPILFACQKDSVEPNGQNIGTLSDTLEAKKCTEYSFYHKDYGNFNLGNAQGGTILVGFAENISATARQQLLAKHKEFATMEDETFGAYSKFNVVHLKPGSTCADAEKFVKQLENHKSVVFAKPTVNDPDGLSLWWGITDEFIVSFIGEEHYSEFEKLSKNTNARILEVNNWDGFYFCVLNVAKNSKKDIFEMCSLFNQQPFILEAAPNFIYKLKPYEFSANPEITTNAEAFKKKGAAAFKNKKKQK